MFMESLSLLLRQRYTCLPNSRRLWTSSLISASNGTHKIGSRVIERWQQNERPYRPWVGAVMF